MSCVTQKVKTVDYTGNWTSTFPNEIKTEVQSNLFMKKLIAVAISSITYLRAIFPEGAFGDRNLEDLQLKILSENSGCPGACQVISWIKGSFDALEKKYLRQLMIGIYLNPDEPDNVIEAYTFRFTYDQETTTVSCNDEKLASVLNNSTTELTKKATLSLLRTIVLLMQTLEPLPDSAYLTMKLLYYDEITPPDYEPPGFKPADTDCFFFQHEPINIKVGDVSTPFHTLKLRIKTDQKQFDVIDEIDENRSSTRNAAKLVAEDNKNEKDRELMVKNEKSPLQEKKEVEAMQLGSPDSSTDDKEICIEELDEIQCLCGLTEMDELMLMCDICNKQQHAVCFGIPKKEDLPEKHICETCCDNTNPSKLPTDSYISGLFPIEQQALCVWRRALVLVKDFTTITTSTLVRKMNIEKCIADSIMNRLGDEGYISNGKGKNRGRKVVNKSLIMMDGFSKYLTRVKEEPSNRKPQEKEFVKQNDEKITDDHIKKVEKLTAEASKLTVSQSKQMKNDNLQTKGKKRAITLDKEQTEFDISNSQDLPEKMGKAKRQKASSIKKGVPV